MTLEDLTAAVGAADTIAARVTERYLDFEPVHRALADTTFRPAAAPAEPPATPRADTVPTDPAVRTRRYSATSVSAARDSVGPRSRSWPLCVDD